MSDPSAMVCRRVIYHGRVQGVGFRWTASRIATRFVIDGFVRNRSDGCVELLVQGETGEVDGFLDDLGAEMSRHIQRTDVTEEPVQADLSGFSIRH